MALSETANLLIRISAQNGANAALTGLHNDLSGLKNKILELGAALGVGLGLKSIIDETKTWAEQTRGLQAELGVTAEAASRLNYMAQVFGISAEELNTSLGRLAKQMFSTSVEADKGKSVFDKWGLAIKDASGNTKNIIDVLGEAAGKIQQMGDGAAARALEMDIFGRAGGRLHELLLQGADGVKALARESDALGLTLNGQSLAAMYNLTIQSNKLGLAFDGLKVALGQVLLPILINVVEGLTKFIVNIISALKNSQLFAGIIKALGSAFQYFLGIIKDVVDKVRIFAAEIGQKGFVGALLDLAGGLKDILLRVLGDIGSKLDSLGTLGMIAKDALIGLAAVEVLSAIGNVALALKGISVTKLLITVDAILLTAMVDQIQQTVALIEANPVKMRIAWESGQLDNLIGQGILYIGIFAAAAALAAGAIPLAMAFAIGSALGLIILNFPKIIAFIGNLFDTLGTTIHGALEAIGKDFESKRGDFMTTWNTLTHDIQTAFDGVGEHIGGFFDALGTTVSNILRMIQEIIDLLPFARAPSPNSSTADNAAAAARGYATGGIVSAQPGGTLVRVGEGGSAEAIVPLNSGNVMGTTNIYVTVSGNVTDSEQALADKVGDALMRAVGHSRLMAF